MIQIAIASFTRLAVALLAIATLLPLLPVGAWTVRLFDFPRVQLAAIACLPIGGILIWSRIDSWKLEHTVHTAFCTAILLWQLSHIVKYSPVWPTELAETEHARDTDVFSSSVVNLQFENSKKSAVREQLSAHNCDLLLLIEIDAPWAEALRDLEGDYPYRDGVIRGDGLGIMLWSKLPIISSEVRHLVSSKRASIFAKIQISRDRVVNFVGVHPTPPGLDDPNQPGRHDSRIRDAELMLVAKEIAERPDDYWIVSGDFNDVAWSHTTRVFKRISGLKDPRVGRGLFNTYHAKYPLLRFPIDQVFLSPGTRITKLRRFHPTGSDHFAITTEFSLAEITFNEPEPRDGDLEEAEKMIKEGKKDARQNDVESQPGDS